MLKIVDEDLAQRRVVAALRKEQDEEVRRAKSIYSDPSLLDCSIVSGPSKPVSPFRIPVSPRSPRRKKTFESVGSTIIAPSLNIDIPPNPSFSAKELTKGINLPLFKATFDVTQLRQKWGIGNGFNTSTMFYSWLPTPLPEWTAQIQEEAPPIMAPEGSCTVSGGRAAKTKNLKNYREIADCFDEHMNSMLFIKEENDVLRNQKLKEARKLEQLRKSYGNACFKRLKLHQKKCREEMESEDEDAMNGLQDNGDELTPEAEDTNDLRPGIPVRRRFKKKGEQKNTKEQKTVGKNEPSPLLEEEEVDFVQNLKHTVAWTLRKQERLKKLSYVGLTRKKENRVRLKKEEQFTELAAAPDFLKDWLRVVWIYFLEGRHLSEFHQDPDRKITQTPNLRKKPDDKVTVFLNDAIQATLEIISRKTSTIEAEIDHPLRSSVNGEKSENKEEARSSRDTFLEAKMKIEKAWGFSIDHPLLNKEEVSSAVQEMGIRGRSLQEKGLLRSNIEKTFRKVFRPIKGTELPAEYEDENNQRLDFLTFSVDIILKIRKKILQSSRNLFYETFKRHDDGSGSLNYIVARRAAKEMVDSDKFNPSDDTTILDETIRREGKKRSKIEFSAFCSIVFDYRQHVDALKRLTERSIISKFVIPYEIRGKYYNQMATMLSKYWEHEQNASPMQMEEKQSRSTQQGAQKYDWSTGSVHMKHLPSIIRELGILPRKKKDRDKVNLDYIFQNIYRQNGDALDFPEFLKHVCDVKTFIFEISKEDLIDKFHELDKDRSGALSTQELDQLLFELGITPKNPQEQAVIRELIEEVDDDDDVGSISFGEFVKFYQRTKETLTYNEFERDKEIARNLGFRSEEIDAFYDAWDLLDVDGSGGLDIVELRGAMNLLHKYVSAEVLRTQFESVDKDGSGYLEFREFLHIMHMFLQKEGLFADKPPPFTTLDSFDSLQVWRTAEVLGMPKEIVRTLPRQELLRRICIELHQLNIDPTENFATTFQVHDHDELIRVLQLKIERKKMYAANTTQQYKQSQSQIRFSSQLGGGAQQAKPQENYRRSSNK